MITLKGIVGSSIRVPLYSSSLTTGLTLTDLSIDAALDGEYISSFVSDYSVSLSEIDSSNYANSYSLSIVPQQEGVLIITVTYSSYEQSYIIQVYEEDVSYLAGKIKGSVGDYTLTINDSEASPIEGVMVRVYNSAQTKLLHTLKTDSNGEVEISAPVGEYKAVLTKSNYSFSNPKSITIVGNQEVPPRIKELVPSSSSAGSIIAIKGLHFGDGTQVRFDGTYVTPSSISTSEDVLLVTVPSTLSGSSVEVGIRKSDPSNPGSYLTGINTLTLGLS